MNLWALEHKEEKLEMAPQCSCELETKKFARHITFFGKYLKGHPKGRSVIFHTDMAGWLLRRGT